MLGLFRSDHQSSRTFGWEAKADAPKDDEAKFDWSFVPDSDLILVTGEGLVGITAEGVFVDSASGGRRLTFEECFKRPGGKNRKKEEKDSHPRARSKWDMPG